MPNQSRISSFFAKGPSHVAAPGHEPTRPGEALQTGDDPPNHLLSKCRSATQPGSSALAAASAPGAQTGHCQSTAQVAARGSAPVMAAQKRDASSIRRHQNSSGKRHNSSAGVQMYLDLGQVGIVFRGATFAPGMLFACTFHTYGFSITLFPAPGCIAVCRPLCAVWHPACHDQRCHQLNDAHYVQIQSEGVMHLI